MTTENQNTQSKPATQALSDPAGYTVCFKRVVAKGPSSGGSNRDVWLSHTMTLPFVPPIGMEVCDGDDWSFTVQELCYKEGVIFAFEEREKPNERTDDEMEEIVKKETEYGWSLSDNILSV